MTEKEIKNVDETNEEVLAQGETPEKTDGEKSFTQKELDRILKERIQREKVGSQKVLDDANAQINAQAKAIEGYEKILSKFIETQIKDFPENIKLLISRLPVLEQMEWLSDPSNQIEGSKKIPSTPKETESKGAGKSVKQPFRF